MEEKRFVRLINTASKSGAEQIIAYLKEEGIIAYCQGNLMDLYAGNSVTGDVVMVSEDDYQKAKELIADFEVIDVVGSSQGRKVSKKHRIVIWIFLIMIAVVLIWTALANQ